MIHHLTIVALADPIGGRWPPRHKGREPGLMHFGDTFRSRRSSIDPSMPSRRLHLKRLTIPSFRSEEHDYYYILIDSGGRLMTPYSLRRWLRLQQTCRSAPPDSEEAVRQVHLRLSNDPSICISPSHPFRHTVLSKPRAKILL